MPKSQIFMSKNQNKMKKVQHNKNIWRHNDRKVPKFEGKLINLQIQSQNIQNRINMKKSIPGQITIKHYKLNTKKNTESGVKLCITYR